MTIGERLREVRESREMNKTQFAKFLHLPYTTYIGYESGNRQPKMSTLADIAKKLNLDLDYFLIYHNSDTISKISSYSDIISMLFQIEETGILYELILRSSFDKEPDYVPIEVKDTTMKFFIMQWSRMKYVLQQNMIDQAGYDAWKTGILQQYANTIVNPDKKKQ